MKILYESDLAGSKYHGMAYRIYQFSKEFTDREHEVMVVAASYSHTRRINPNVTGRLTNENIDGIQYKWIKTLNIVVMGWDVYCICFYIISICGFMLRK